eukprot:TRINITY_DN3998_c0_g2_i10.p1 TRINITY_DN3998_c0_g2~~TRINITY_DN3998_c0_g2_i10.p1  ORF type:complete len:400 (+),score=48.12 TRINITY_DN3998_c0_g2_i10:149-1348(+)
MRSVIVFILLLVIICSLGLSPVVLVPGLVGSVIEGKFDRPHVPYWDCSRKSDWHTVFLSLWEAARPNCLINELEVFYDPNTGKYSNQPGVQLRAYDFGGIDGVIALDPNEKWLTQTFLSITEDLQDDGYVVGKTLFGAPYDWRMASAGLEQEGYFSAVKDLIENAVESNGELATIISHSMGCLVVQYFLQSQSDDWIKKNVKDYIAISCPWQGAVPMLKASISGDNFDLPIPDGILHPLQSTAPSGDWLLPRIQAWGSDEILVETQGGQKYAADDLKQLLLDCGLQQAAEVYDSVVEAVQNITLPESVRLTCIYGKGVETEAQYQYQINSFAKDKTPSPPKVTKKSDGDGTVNIRSLEAQKGVATMIPLTGQTHVGILMAVDCKKAIKQILDINPVVYQ